MTKQNEHWVILPLGGSGKRLKPYTDQRSKALVPIINNYPITELLFSNLAYQLGIRHFVFGVHGYRNYLDTQSYYQGGSGWSAKLGLKPQANFQYQNPNYQDQGSADSVLYNIKKFRLDNLVIVVQNDNLFSPKDLAKMLAVAKSSPLPFFIGLAEVDNPSQYGVAVLDKKGERIRQFIEKPKKGQTDSKLINTGVYLIKPKAFGYLNKDFGKDTLPILLKKGLLAGYRFKHPWYDFGSPQLHLASFQKILSTSFDYFKPFLEKICLKVPNKNVWIRGRDYYSFKISKEIRKRIEKGEIKTEGAVLIGRDCVLGNNVCLKNSSIGDMAIIENNVTIENSNIMDGWHFGQKVTIANSLLGRRGLVADFCQIKDSFLGDDVNVGTKVYLNKAMVGNHEAVLN